MTLSGKLSPSEVSRLARVDCLLVGGVAALVAHSRWVARSRQEFSEPWRMRSALGVTLGVTEKTPIEAAQLWRRQISYIGLTPAHQTRVPEDRST